MVKIIPTVFALKKEEFEDKLHKLSFVSDLHIDFMDGKFTNKESVSLENMGKLKEFPKIHFGLHLMAYNPEKYINKIIDLGIKKVLIQIEVFDGASNLIETVEKFHNRGLNVYLVLNPDTSSSCVMKYLEIVEGIMFMSVVPGAEGQKFIENVLEKVKEIKCLKPNTVIQIDGGIDDSNVRKVISAGVEFISVGSFISSSNTPEKKFKLLNDLIIS